MHMHVSTAEAGSFAQYPALTLNPVPGATLTTLLQQLQKNVALIRMVLMGSLSSGNSFLEVCHHIARAVC